MTLLQVCSLPLLIEPPDSPIYVTIVQTLYKKNQITFSEFIGIVEYELLDIVDLIFKIAIRSYSNSYYICGGKAINNLITNKCLIKSFDFDIHVQNDHDIRNIGEHIATKMNGELTQCYRKILTRRIYQKLKKLEIVDLTHVSDYMDNSLFFYGARYHRVYKTPIYGIFMKLKLKPGIFLYETNIINY